MNICTGGEGLLACSGHDDRLDVVVLFATGDRCIELERQWHTQGVEHLRPIQGDERHAIGLLKENVLKAHCGLSMYTQATAHLASGSCVSALDVPPSLILATFPFNRIPRLLSSVLAVLVDTHPASVKFPSRAIVRGSPVKSSLKHLANRRSMSAQAQQWGCRPRRMRITGWQRSRSDG